MKEDNVDYRSPSLKVIELDMRHRLCEGSDTKGKNESLYEEDLEDGGFHVI